MRRDVGVSDLRGGGVGGVSGRCSRVGEGVTLWGDTPLRVDSIVIKDGEGGRILTEGEGARRSLDLH